MVYYIPFTPSLRLFFFFVIPSLRLFMAHLIAPFPLLYYTSTVCRHIAMNSAGEAEAIST